MKHRIVWFNSTHTRVARREEFAGPYFGMVRLPASRTCQLTRGANTHPYTQETPAGCEIWRMTSNLQDILDAPPGGAVYGETYDACLDELERLYAPPEGFTRVARLNGEYIDEAGSNHYTTLRVDETWKGEHNLPAIEAVVHAPAYVVPEDAERIYAGSYYGAQNNITSARRDEILAEVRRLAEAHDGPMPLVPFKAARQVAEYLRAHKEPGEPGEALATTIGGTGDRDVIDWRNGRLWAHAVRFDRQMHEKRKKRAAYVEKKANAKLKAAQRLRDVSEALRRLNYAVTASLRSRAPGYNHAESGGGLGYPDADDVGRIDRNYQGDRIAERLMLHRQLFGDNDHVEWKTYLQARSAVAAAELTQAECNAVGLSDDLKHELTAFPLRARRAPRAAKVSRCGTCRVEQRQDPKRMRAHKPLVAGKPATFLCKHCGDDLLPLEVVAEPRVEAEAGGRQVEDVEDTPTRDQAVSSAVASSPA